MKRFRIIVLILSAALFGCTANPDRSTAGAAVERYLQSLVAQDANAMIAAACSDWENQARLEYDSFAAVKLELNQLACSPTGDDGSTVLVGCTGSIIANYGNEDLEIDVAERTYRVVQEGGEWRMCGYHQP